jgi:hypothetical protein
MSARAERRERHAETGEREGRPVRNPARPQVDGRRGSAAARDDGGGDLRSW